MIERLGSWLVVLALAATSVAAQTPGGAQATTPAPQRAEARGQRAGDPAAAAVTPAAALNQVQDMLDQLVLVRAQPELRLSDPQWVAFVPKMRALLKLRRQHQRERAALIVGLNQSTKPGSTADEATIASNVKALDDLEARMATDERAAVAAVDAVLTTYQRARFRVLEENMEREKLRLIAKVLAAPGGEPAPSPAPPSAPDAAGS